MRSHLMIIAAVLLAFGGIAAQATEKTAPGGTGVVDSAEGKGETTKDTSTMRGESSKSGQASGNAPGGTGVETSSQSEASKNKTTND